jgi:replicative DNA helicase
MKDRKAEKAIQDKIDAAVEAPVHPDQRDIEAAVLATLAEVINSDVSDLKYSLLELDAADFYFRDHRDAFAAMKTLADAGDHVDQLTIKAKGASWPDISKAKPEAAETYKRQIIARANIRQAAGIGRDFQDAVASADPDDIPGLIAGLQKTVFDIERTKRFMPPDRPEADLIEDFILDLENPIPGYKTGFDRLDFLINGLKPGVFVIAAPPSAGKTTLVKQMADQVAEFNDGVPVLFLSYEQSAAELRTKTLARLSRKENQLIREGKVKGRAIKEAAEKYRDFGRRLKIIEADFHHNIGTIRLLAQREKLQTGKAPAVFIDYLQVVPVADPSLKDKRAEVDFLISELRRLARELGTPIIAVSSMPRSEYKHVKMSGFKESGGIEYGTDIAAIMDVKEEFADVSERIIDLAIIKNRNGRRKIIRLKYEMMFDAFREESDDPLNYLDTLGKEDED